MFIFKKIIKLNILDSLCVAAIVFYSIFLGSTYSQYHTDPWHWGSIISNSIDYINGFKLFKEIVLLWGPGQPILYSLINNFYKIDYYTIGIITSIVYFFFLMLSYLIIKKLSNKIIAISILFIIFCLLPYPQTPWPDFYSGLCLVLSCYYLNSANKNNIILFISSSFLSLSIIFRNTYILQIIPAIIFFCLLFIVHRKKMPKIYKDYFLYFFITITLFFFILLMQNNLKLWFEQGIGRINEYQDINNTIYNYKISPFIYSIVKFVYHLFFPTRIENYYYLIIFFLNCGIIFLFFFNKKFFEEINNNNCNIIFFSILGLFGIIQSFNQYEIWRHINSSISIFFVLSYFLNKFLKKMKHVLTTGIGLMIFFFPLFPHKNKNNDWKYYNGTNYFAVIGYIADGKLIKDKKLYLESTISFFGDHRFTNEHLEYYKEIRFLICDYDRIINYSVDRTLTYICDKKNRIVSTYPRAKGRPIFKENKLEKKFNNENLNKNEIIIAGKDFFNNNLKLLKIITMPRGTRYTHSDVFMRYFDSEIYLYIKN
jgi:hypothetical protein